MTEHQDVLKNLNQHIPLKEKLIATHNTISKIFLFITRIARITTAIYAPETTALKNKT